MTSRSKPAAAKKNPSPGMYKRVKDRDTALNFKLHKYRSGLEIALSAQMLKVKIPFEYESLRLGFLQPSIDRSYTPDFILDNGIIIEAKGQLDSDDRKKMILVRKTFPNLDIRFVFSYANGKIYKGSKTTYASWSAKNGYLCATKSIPIAWLKEDKKPFNFK